MRLLHIWFEHHQVIDKLPEFPISVYSAQSPNQGPADNLVYTEYPYGFRIKSRTT